MKNIEGIVKTVVDRLVEHIGRISYGKIIITLSIHQSNVVSISQEVTQTIKRQEELNEK